jgi:hypothetical protein
MSNNARSSLSFNINKLVNLLAEIPETDDKFEWIVWEATLNKVIEQLQKLDEFLIGMYVRKE